MIGTIASLTARALLSRRRLLLLAAPAGLIVLVAALYRLADPAADEVPAFTGRLLADFGVGVLLPIVAVIVGTAAIGSEIEDGTIVYLLAKPIRRLTIVAVKLAVAWAACAVIVTPGIAIAGVVAAGGATDLAAAYVAAALVGALEYTAVFVALSLLTARALVVGLAYVVIWEGVVAGLFAGTRPLSIRQHALAVADALGGPGAVEATLGASGPVLAAIVVVLAFVVAVRRLERVELRGETG